MNLLRWEFEQKKNNIVQMKKILNKYIVRWYHFDDYTEFFSLVRLYHGPEITILAQAIILSYTRQEMFHCKQMR